MHACCSCVVLDRFFFFFSSRRRHTRWPRDWSSDVCSSDLGTSIIHGIAASRAGMSLPAILGRRLGRDVVGLGFSGNGKMEKIGRASCRERGENGGAAGGWTRNGERRRGTNETHSVQAGTQY